MLNEPRYTVAAARAADFLLARMRRADGILLRRYRDGDAAIEGMLDDYAFFAQGLLDLYEATFHMEYLDSAIAITDKQKSCWSTRRAVFIHPPTRTRCGLVRSPLTTTTALSLPGNSISA